MKYWFYRWFMVFAHHRGWHKMEELHPEGDTMFWCQWCGLRVVTKRHPPVPRQNALGQDANR
jgi:DNA-directed RNA polymerase subunit RPC12/RpoP